MREDISRRLLKFPTIYARGEHTFSDGGVPVEMMSGGETKMPIMIPLCFTGLTCGRVINQTIEAELSEDIDTGSLGDAIALITGIAEILVD